nr:MAG TPA: hypothetical protein [Caudoviricetes sp.]
MLKLRLSTPAKVFTLNHATVVVTVESKVMTVIKVIKRLRL